MFNDSVVKYIDQLLLRSTIDYQVCVKQRDFRDLILGGLKTSVVEGSS